MSSSSLSEEPAGDITWSLQYRVTAQTLKEGEKGFDITPTHLIRSEEALSSLYSFELKQESVGRDAANMLNAWLGKRVELTISHQKEYDGGSKTDETKIRTVYGIVTSVTSGPVESYEQFSSGWYTLTIEPEFSAACYSRNRAVYLSDAAPTLTEDAEEPEVSTKEKEDDKRCKVLLDIAKRWNTVCVVSPAAKKRIPDYLQLVQNDESDYNFFCRLLSTWGLGYCWKMDESENVKKEYIYVYDVLGGENPNQEEEDAEKEKTSTPVEPLACMCSRGGGLRAWRLNRGYHSLDMEKVGVQNYLGAFSTGTADANRLLLSLHDETWDQLQSKATDAAAYGKWHFLNRHFNAGDVHGTYAYCCEGSKSDDDRAHLSSVLQLRMSAKVTWAPIAAAPEEAQPYNIDTSPYFLTRRVMTGDRWNIKMDFSGRAPQEIIVAKATKEGEEDTTQTIGGGILPRPLTPNPDPDLDEDAPLLKEAAWESPKPRTFMAVVTSNVPHNYQGRNFCRVRELNGEEMWVEMGSPNADSNSGIFARPRKDNVLFCMDRGDLSIPIVLSAMFRGRSDVDNDTTNAAPLTKLRVMDRHTRAWETEKITQKNKEGEDEEVEVETRPDDNSALTMRSRAHVPVRKKESGDKLAVHDREIKADDLLFAQRPQSVADLAKHPKPFNQIQMFSLDNGVKPIQQDPGLVDSCNADAIAETVIGFTTGADYSAGFAGCARAEGIQNESNTPISRPHLQGISTYSSGDLLTQSADHQIMNAGGEIVLTAAQAITLRVGRSYVRISEYGVDIGSDIGDMQRTGAYPAYHPTDNAEKNECTNGDGAPLVGGHITVDAVGVYNKGVYISNTAVNAFAANTVLGSAFTLSDFDARLYAPAVNIIGGAAIESTLLSACKEAIFAGTGNAGRTDANPVFTGPLVDGYKMKGYHKAYDYNCGLAGVCAGLGAIGSIWSGGIEKYKNLFSVSGSMIKMLPERMVFSSLARFDYSSEVTKVQSASAGFIATAENCAFGTKRWGNKNLFGVGKTVANLTGAWINACGSGKGYDDTEKDTFTAADVENDNAIPGVYDKTDGKDEAALAALIVGTIAGIILSIVNPFELLAQCFFGKRKDGIVGIESEEQLMKTVTNANQDSAIAAKNMAIANMTSAFAVASKAAAEITAINANQNLDALQKSEQIAQQEEIIASPIATLTQSDTLAVNTSVKSTLNNKTIAMEISN